MNSPLLKNFLLLPVLLLVGCQPRTDVVATIAETVIVGPEYSANKGLFVPEETQRSLGLKVVEIGEQKIAATLELSLRVYEIGRDVVRASGTVMPEQAKALRVGQTLEIRTKDGETATGKITALSGEMQKVTGVVEVLVELPKPTTLPVGAFVAANVTLDAGESAATVPRSALVQSTAGYFVYTVSGRHFVRVPVKLGALNADVAQITEGLYAGDQVVSEPAMSLWLTELAAVKG